MQNMYFFETGSSCFDEKVTLLFYKRIRLELIVYLLQLYVFFMIPDFARHATVRQRKIQQWQKDA